ncbi:MAG: hypothetical protein OXE94_11995 [Aestuariivita sp.]|nr:hypothetical protein [Aestuariivita sp.]MCY4201677.1 hypothetical protein [Aestuariivita sp.]
MTEPTSRENPSGMSILGNMDSGPWLLPIFVTLIAVSMAVYWGLPEENDQAAIYFVWAVSVCVGAILGSRYGRIGNTAVVSSALSAGLRLGIVWLLLAGMVEYVLTDKTATHTVNFLFPRVLLALLALTAVSFYLSNYATVYIQRIKGIDGFDRRLSVYIGMGGIILSFITVLLSVSDILPDIFEGLKPGVAEDLTSEGAG